MSDFGFYGEENDEVQEQQIKGISGDVTGFVYTDLQYPCIIFKEGFTCPRHKLKVISNMVKTSSDEKDTSLYFIQNDELFQIGMLSGVQINAFLEIIGEENVIGFYDADTKLENSMLYTLCTVI